VYSIVPERDIGAHQFHCWLIALGSTLLIGIS
jgi:hypothetical protein